jgi:hypothetical protein
MKVHRCKALRGPVQIGQPVKFSCPEKSAKSAIFGLQKLSSQTTS